MTHLIGAGQTAANSTYRLLYVLYIWANDVQQVKVPCIEVDYITPNSSAKTDVSAAYSLFQQIPREALRRPVEKVSILIGQSAGSLLASGGEDRDLVDNLRAMRCKLGFRWVLGGNHPWIILPTTGQNISVGTAIFSHSWFWNFFNSVPCLIFTNPIWSRILPILVNSFKYFY